MEGEASGSLNALDKVGAFVAVLLSPAHRCAVVCVMCATLLIASGCVSPHPTPPPAPGPSGGGALPPPSSPPQATQSLRGGEAFANGVTGCWVLPNGTVLIESAGKGGQLYSCLSTIDNSVEAVTPDTWDCVLRDIRDDSMVFIRRKNPTGGASPDIVTFSLDTLKQVDARAVKSDSDLTITVARQPVADSVQEPEPPSEWLSWLSDGLEGGVAACWLLPDGTILLAGPYQVMQFRYYPKHNQASFVASDALMATVIAITPTAVKLLCNAEGPTAMQLFPYIITYDLKTSQRGKPEPVFLPATAGVTVGWPHDSRDILLKSIEVKGDSVSIIADDAMWSEPAEYVIRSVPDQQLLIIEMRGTKAESLQLPLVLDSNSGLIRSVRAEAGVAGEVGAGVTVTLSLDDAKWPDLTYNCEFGSAFRLTVYADREPTDTSIKVRP